MPIPPVILGQIKDKEAIIKELEKLIPRSRTPQERASREMEIRRKKQEIAGLKARFSPKPKFFG